MTRSHAAVLFVGIGALTAACSSDGPNSAAVSTDPPAVCSSTDQLQESMADLGDVQVVEDGTSALEDAVTSVRSALQRVVDDATAQYSSQVDGLQADFDAVQTAAGAAMDAPTAETVNAVTASIRVLAGDVSTFADDVATTC